MKFALDEFLWMNFSDESFTQFVGWRSVLFNDLFQPDSSHGMEISGRIFEKPNSSKLEFEISEYDYAIFCLSTYSFRILEVQIFEVRIFEVRIFELYFSISPSSNSDKKP